MIYHRYILPLLLSFSFQQEEHVFHYFQIFPKYPALILLFVRGNSTTKVVSLAIFTSYVYFTAMFRYYPMTDAQTKSCSLTDFFCGKKWIEYAF